MWTRRSTCWTSFASPTTPDCCISRLATLPAPAMGASVKPRAWITPQQARLISMLSKSGTRCTAWWKKPSDALKARKSPKNFASQAMAKEHAAKDLQGAALENQIRKNRVRWLRNELTEAGKRRANELGWPNTYTLTKSLAESLLARNGAGLPIAIVRPAIVESSTDSAFSRMERGHQHLGVALVSAGDVLPPVADQRAQAAGCGSGGHRLPRHDVDCSGGHGAAE